MTQSTLLKADLSFEPNIIMSIRKNLIYIIMKKIVVTMLLFSFIFEGAFASTGNNKDQKELRKVYIRHSEFSPILKNISYLYINKKFIEINALRAEFKTKFDEFEENYLKNKDKKMARYIRLDYTYAKNLHVSVVEKWEAILEKYEKQEAYQDYIANYKNPEKAKEITEVKVVKNKLEDKINLYENAKVVVKEVPRIVSNDEGMRIIREIEKEFLKTSDDEMIPTKVKSELGIEENNLLSLEIPVVNEEEVKKELGIQEEVVKEEEVVKTISQKTKKESCKIPNKKKVTKATKKKENIEPKEINPLIVLAAQKALTADLKDSKPKTNTKDKSKKKVLKDRSKPLYSGELANIVKDNKEMFHSSKYNEEKYNSTREKVYNDLSKSIKQRRIITKNTNEYKLKNPIDKKQDIKKEPKTHFFFVNRRDPLLMDIEDDIIDLD